MKLEIQEVKGQFIEQVPQSAEKKDNTRDLQRSSLIIQL